jgi:tetratricopeptide (TPR) repeat protein
MKPFITMLMIFLVVLLFNSCKEDPDEETLLLYSRSAAAYAQGRFEESASILEGVRNFSPALLLRSKGLYFSGRGTEAEQLLRRTLHRNPESGEASLFLARVLREQGREDEAQTLAEAMLRNDPQDIRALRLAADLAGQRGDTENAAALLDRAAEAAAEAALVFIDRAKLRWTAGNGRGALEDLRRAEILLPWNTALGRGIGDLRRLIAEEVQLHSEEAEK